GATFGAVATLRISAAPASGARIICCPSAQRKFKQNQVSCKTEIASSPRRAGISTGNIPTEEHCSRSIFTYSSGHPSSGARQYHEAKRTSVTFPVCIPFGEARE